MSPTAASGTVRYRRALSWSLLMVGGQQGVTALVSFVLAAILGPSSFGIVAMASVYILFIQMLLQQAIPAIIQRKDLEPEHVDSAFWLVMAAALVITGISVALSGAWAAVNRTPDLQPIIMVLSLLVPLQGLVVVQEAVLRRSMDFRSLAVRSLVAAALGGLVGIAMALRGAGTWALVGQQLSTAIVGTIVLWSVSSWRPRLRFSWAHVRDLVGFSVGSSLASLAAFVNVRSDVMLIGLFFGAFAVGLYRLASRFTEIVVDFLSRSMQQVAFPELSRLQADTSAFATRMRDIMAQSSLLTLPALGVLAGCAHPILRLFGPEWVGASGALQILCLVAGVKALTLVATAGIQGIGRPHVLAVLSWVAAALSAGALVAAGVALQGAAVADQVLGMAMSRAVVYLALIGPIEVVVLHRCCALTPRSLLGAIREPALIGIAAALAGVLWTGVGLPGSWPPAAALAATAAVTGSLTVGLLALVNWQALVSAGRTVRRVVARPSRAPGVNEARHVQPTVVSQMLAADGSGLDQYRPRHLATRPRASATVPKRTIVARHPPPRRTRAPKSNLTTDGGGRMGGRPPGVGNGSRRTDLSRGAASVDLWASLGVIGRRWKITVPLVVLTVAAALATGSVISSNYEASASILLVGPAGPDTAAGTTTTTAAPGGSATTATAAPVLDEREANPLLTLNQSLISTARATTEVISDQNTRQQLSEAGLSTDYEVTVAQKDPIMQLMVTAPQPTQALETLDALQNAILEDLNARQAQAGAPAQTHIQVQTLSTTERPRVLNAGRVRAQLVVVALGFAVTAIAAFAAEAFAQRRFSAGGAAAPPRSTAEEQRLVPPPPGLGPESERAHQEDGAPGVRAGRLKFATQSSVRRPPRGDPSGVAHPHDPDPPGYGNGRRRQ
ncbi:MAG: lipopolysaccharide biosynthesis protein [Acidimicrobiales bacterium]